MRYLILLYCFVNFYTYGQEDNYLRKLGVLSKKTWSIQDSVVINRLNETATDSLFSNAEKTRSYALIAYKHSKKIEYADGEIHSLRSIIKSSVVLSEFDSARVYVNKLQVRMKRVTSPKLLTNSYETIGNFYDYQGKYDEAVNYYLKAIQIAKKKDESIANLSYHNLGLIYKKLNNFEKAYFYQKKARTLARKSNNLEVLASSLNNLGILKKGEKKYQEAINFYEEGLIIAKKLGDPRLEGALLGNISNVYFEMGNSEKGMYYFEQSLDWVKRTKSYYELAMSYNNFAYNLIDMNRLDEAARIADTALEYSLICNSHEFIMESYLVKAELNYQLGNYKEAYNAVSNAFAYKDSMNLVSLSDKITDLQGAFERKEVAIKDSLARLEIMKERKRDQQLNNEKVWFRDVLLGVALFILGLVAIGAVLLFRSNRKVIAKNIIVEKQHKEITDSINYAQRIQSAMISNDEAWKQISPHRSIFFKPKDVVSGDFYWAHFNLEKKLAIWSVADCTGHGVPGAFMSVLGSSFLTDIIVDDGETDPAKILNLLRKKVISSLTNEGEDQPKDGMDLGLCVWEKDTNILHFAGANNPLYILRRKENASQHNFERFIDLPEQNSILIEVPPNKMPIGSYVGNESPFSSVTLPLFLGDTLILSTDGFADQFGGENGKKLKSRPFKEFLLSIQDSSMAEQSHLIKKQFEDWQGTYEQLDDVCVVGIRIS